MRLGVFSVLYSQLPFEEALDRFRGMGLDAVEAWHPEHPPNQAEAFEKWASELGMLVTAGSDYHGPTVQPGRRLGDRRLAEDRFAALEALSRRPRALPAR